VPLIYIYIYIYKIYNNNCLQIFNISRLFRKELSANFNSKIIWAINGHQCQWDMQNSGITRGGNIVALLRSGLTASHFWSSFCDCGNNVKSRHLPEHQLLCLIPRLITKKNPCNLTWNPNRTSTTKGYLMSRVNILWISNQCPNGTSVEMGTLTHQYKHLKCLGSLISIGQKCRLQSTLHCLEFGQGTKG
jgi:hypothetical protein